MHPAGIGSPASHISKRSSNEEGRALGGDDAGCCARRNGVERNLRRVGDGDHREAITIGGSFPLTGPVSLYATIPTAMKAYFSYINSRKGPDGRRGIYGRQIVFKMYDDAYNPAQTVQQARRLVEQDKVFAVVGQLGTEHNEAIRPYMNERKVPQILNATGASSWYTPANAAKYPWTRGWFPTTSSRAGCTARRSRATARTRRSRC